MNERINLFFIFLVVVMVNTSCKKNDNGSPAPVVQNFTLLSASINGKTASTQYGVVLSPVIRLSFNAPIDHSSVSLAINLAKITGAVASLTTSYENADSVLILNPSPSLSPVSKYNFEIKNILKSRQGIPLSAGAIINFNTAIDSTDKFPLLSDNALLDKVQQQTFTYFWDFGHPVSGMARERDSDPNTVTTGGTGFGIMAIITAISRGFITRVEGRDRILKITNFLTTNCTKYHGAFAHWINGSTGTTIPFSANDDGGDLVETSYLIQGLITAREYFNSIADATETELRTKINALWNSVEWNWYRQNNQNVLYWHWSPANGWAINQQITGWNEALITYVLAAASPVAANKIPATVYTNGWAGNGSIVNNNTYFSYQLPLGPPLGGPLFFEHYSFLCINPNGLNDTYADYSTQAINHTKINFEYCKANPHGWYGYSDLCWGLTASDIENGYNASSPSNDLSVIAPTAAISSMPYTPAESMNALKFFYYKLGDKIWGNYGFTDAFSLNNAWFATSTLAIDQGPIIVMIENYRTGLLWNLFTNAPEIKTGMIALGFSAPYL